VHVEQNAKVCISQVHHVYDEMRATLMIKRAALTVVLLHVPDVLDVPHVPPPKCDFLINLDPYRTFSIIFDNVGKNSNHPKITFLWFIPRFLLIELTINNFTSNNYRICFKNNNVQVSFKNWYV
jgi:hypothetical protein